MWCASRYETLTIHKEMDGRSEVVRELTEDTERQWRWHVKGQRRVSKISGSWVELAQGGGYVSLNRLKYLGLYTEVCYPFKQIMDDG